jgi:hypothetical protein
MAEKPNILYFLKQFWIIKIHRQNILYGLAKTIIPFFIKSGWD